MSENFKEIDSDRLNEKTKKIVKNAKLFCYKFDRYLNEETKKIVKNVKIFHHKKGFLFTKIEYTDLNDIKIRLERVKKCDWNIIEVDEHDEKNSIIVSHIKNFDSSNNIFAIIKQAEMINRVQEIKNERV